MKYVEKDSGDRKESKLFHDYKYGYDTYGMGSLSIHVNIKVSVGVNLPTILLFILTTGYSLIPLNYFG